MDEQEIVGRNREGKWSKLVEECKSRSSSSQQNDAYREMPASPAWKSIFSFRPIPFL